LIAAVPAAAAQSSGKTLRLGWLRGPVRLGDGAVRQAASGARILFAGSFDAATFGVFTIASALFGAVRRLGRGERRDQRPRRLPEPEPRAARRGRSGRRSFASTRACSRSPTCF
jgi:hypothetical protein